MTTNPDPDFMYFEVLGNKDQTEGRGGYVLKRAFATEDLAVDWAASPEGHRQCGVMGIGSGQVDQVSFTYAKDMTVAIERTKIWGYRKNWNDNWDFGYIDLRDAPTNDPEYATYLRLKARFNR